jgi:hypothetical protein
LAVYGKGTAVRVAGVGFALASVAQVIWPWWFVLPFVGAQK